MVWLLRSGTGMCPCRMRRERNPAFNGRYKFKPGMSLPEGGNVRGCAHAGCAGSATRLAMSAKKLIPGINTKSGDDLQGCAGRRPGRAGCAGSATRLAIAAR